MERPEAQPRAYEIAYDAHRGFLRAPPIEGPPGCERPCAGGVPAHVILHGALRWARGCATPTARPTAKPTPHHNPSRRCVSARQLEEALRARFGRVLRQITRRALPRLYRAAVGAHACQGPSGLPVGGRQKRHPARGRPTCPWRPPNLVTSAGWLSHPVTTPSSFYIRPPSSPATREHLRVRRSMPQVPA